METMLSVLGAFIFSAYIIYDTQMIMKHLSAEEYVNTQKKKAFLTSKNINWNIN